MLMETGSEYNDVIKAPSTGNRRWWETAGRSGMENEEPV